MKFITASKEVKEQGASLLEYSIISSLIGVAAFFAVQTAGKASCQAVVKSTCASVASGRGLPVTLCQNADFADFIVRNNMFGSRICS